MYLFFGKLGGFEMGKRGKECGGGSADSPRDGHAHAPGWPREGAGLAFEGVEGAIRLGMAMRTLGSALRR
jgi:hypothetical protein